MSLVASRMGTHKLGALLSSKKNKKNLNGWKIYSQLRKTTMETENKNENFYFVIQINSIYFGGKSVLYLILCLTQTNLIPLK